MQFNELARHVLDVGQRVRPLRVATELHALPAGELGVDVLTGRLNPGFQLLDGTGHVDYAVLGYFFDFGELLVEFLQGAFEF